jgi:hypothetical protein
MTTKLPILIFKNRKNNGKNVLYSGCPEVDALFHLMRPRLYLEPNELPYIAKMGYTWEITGDKREFREEWARIQEKQESGTF